MLRGFFERQRREKGRTVAFFVVSGLFLFFTTVYGLIAVYERYTSLLNSFGVWGIVLLIAGFVFSGILFSCIFVTGFGNHKRK